MKRKPKDDLTFEYVNDVLSYNAQTGVLTWKERPRDHFRSERIWRSANRRNAGKVAGSSKGEYVQITFGIANVYYAHRLAWLLHHGQWPLTSDLDHINGNKRDNRIANLREATRSQNIGNMKVPRHNTSGHKGVTWCPTRKKWEVVVKGKYIGSYVSKEDAAIASATAASALYGQFAKT